MILLINTLNVLLIDGTWNTLLFAVPKYTGYETPIGRIGIYLYIYIYLYYSIT